jgi:hypothetical protein
MAKPFTEPTIACAIAADLGAKPVNKPAKTQQTEAIGTLKGGIDHPEFLIGPAQLGIQDFFNQREDLPVDIVDGGGEE